MATPVTTRTVGTTTYIIYSDGSEEVRQGGTRNLRNNNPGNIVYNEYSKSLGAIGSQNGMAVFPDMETGSKAMTTLLTSNSYQNAPAVPSQGLNQGSVGAAIYKWAPPNENDSKSYVQYIEKRTGLPANKPLSECSPAEIEKVRQAIANYEGNTPPNVSNGDKKLSKEEVQEIANAQKEAAKRGNNNTYTARPSAASISSEKLAELIQNKAYKPNMLDYYDNPTYHVCLWFMSNDEVGLYFSLTDEQQQTFIPKTKTVLYESGVTTTFGLMGVELKHNIGPTHDKKKMFFTDLTFDIVEPGGGELLDLLNITCKKLDFKAIKGTPMFMDITFVGYRTQLDTNNPGGQDYCRDENGAIIKRRIAIGITSINASLDTKGFTYRIKGAEYAYSCATFKEYFNFKGTVDIDKRVRDLSTLLKEIEDILNTSSQTGSLGTTVDMIPGKKVYEFNIDFPDAVQIDLNNISNSGESSGKSAKFTINVGDSIEHIIDQFITASNNNDLGVNPNGELPNPDDFPYLLRMVPEVTYHGVAPNGQKALKIKYNIKKYYAISPIYVQTQDYEGLSSVIYNAMDNYGLILDKRYDFIFTSKNSQILHCDLKFDALWTWVSYDDAANQVRDASATPVKKLASLPNGEAPLPTGLAGVQASIQAQNLSISPINAQTGTAMLKYLPENGGIGFENNGIGMSLDMSNLTNQQLVNTVLEQSAPLQSYITPGADPIVDDPTQNYTGFFPIIQQADNIPEESQVSNDAVNKQNLKNASIFEHIYQAGNQLTLKLEIRGDPYWLTFKSENVTGDTSIYFTYKTPHLRKSGDNEDTVQDTFGSGIGDVHTISGVYTVIDVVSRLRNGIFTQQITATYNANIRFKI